MSGCLNVFADEVFTSSDLARRTPHVLNTAKKRPVTVSRNSEQFALLTRETAAEWVARFGIFDELVTLISEARAVIVGTPPARHYSWLAVFEKDDLEKLVEEILAAAREAVLGREDWTFVVGTMHEWRESGLVAQSGALDAAMFSGKPDLVELPHPSSLESEHREMELASAE